MKPYYQDDACTIYHGDCLELADVWDIAGAVLITDPPYGREFRSNQPLTGTTDAIVGDLDVTVRDAVLAIWGLRPAVVFGAWQIDRPPEVRQLLVWDKRCIGMGDLGLPWGPGHEEIYILGTGWSGKRRSSVLSVRTQMARGTWRKRRIGEFHPTAKPLDLMRSLVERAAPLAEIVDPFMGSGTTLRAAKDLGRRAIGIEIEEKYCEIAAKRLAQEVLAL